MRCIIQLLERYILLFDCLHMCYIGMVMASNTGGRPISSKYLRPTSRPPEVSPTGSDASLEVSAPTQRGGSGKLVGRGGERGQLNRWMKLYIKKSSVSTRHVSSTLIPSLPSFFPQRPSLAIPSLCFILPSPSSFFFHPTSPLPFSIPPSPSTCPHLPFSPQ